METQITCRVLTGPTATGKSDLAVRLARARGWEILCMDSMQVYRRMDIGTAKITQAEMQGVPHHLMDILEPDEPFSVSDYRELAEQKVMELHARGREALFVGGTVLYLRALMHPMAMGQVGADENLREELRRIAAEPEGKLRLHRMLQELDPATADRLPVNDLRRVIRAIEVTRLTGIPFSSQPSREQPSPFRWQVAALSLERAELYDRINRRVDRMIEKGLQREVAALLAEGVPENAQSMSGIGYKEMVPCVRGERTLAEAADEIRLNSRHYAKRQMTFLRQEPTIRYFPADVPQVLEKIFI